MKDAKMYNQMQMIIHSSDNNDNDNDNNKKKKKNNKNESSRPVATCEGSVPARLALGDIHIEIEYVLYCNIPCSNMTHYAIV